MAAMVANVLAIHNLLPLVHAQGAATGFNIGIAICQILFAVAAAAAALGGIPAPAPHPLSYLFVMNVPLGGGVPGGLALPLPQAIKVQLSTAAATVYMGVPVTDCGTVCVPNLAAVPMIHAALTQQPNLAGPGPLAPGGPNVPIPGMTLLAVVPFPAAHGPGFSFVYGWLPHAPVIPAPPPAPLPAHVGHSQYDSQDDEEAAKEPAPKRRKFKASSQSKALQVGSDFCRQALLEGFDFFRQALRARS